MNFFFYNISNRIFYFTNLFCSYTQPIIFFKLIIIIHELICLHILIDLPCIFFFLMNSDINL